MGGECDRVPLVVFLDREDRTSCEVRCIRFESELTVVVRVREYGSSSETGLKRCKSLGLCGSPCEHFVLLGQVCEGLCKLRIIFDEAAIEVGEPKEATDAADIDQGRPFRDCFYLGIVHFDAISVDEHAKIFYLRFVKGALFRSCEKIVVVESLENLLHLGLVLRQVALGEDHDVVDVDNNHVLHVSEDFVHHGLEGGGGVAKSKEHDGWFKGPMVTNKHGLPFVSLIRTLLHPHRRSIFVKY